MTEPIRVFQWLKVRLTPGERAALDVIAKQDMRSPSLEVVALIVEEARRRGVALEVSP